MADESRLTAIREREQAATKDDLRLMRYDHGGGRLARFTPVRSGRRGDEDRQLVADFYDEANREFYYHAREDVPYLLDLVREQAEVIQQLRTAQAWQPIATAPKDMTEVLGNFDGVRHVMWWSALEGWMIPGGATAPAQPTHWMPLPAPPAVQPPPQEEP